MTASQPLMERIWALLLALLLGYYFVVKPAGQVWQDYWLVRDAQQSEAVITKEHWAGHGVVVYRYSVNHQEYSGQDHRGYQGPQYARLMPGEKSVVYYSSSHPWLSAFNRPRSAVVEGWPVVLLGWFMEALLIATVINPQSRWAFNVLGRSEVEPLKQKVE